MSNNDSKKDLFGRGAPTKLRPLTCAVTAALASTLLGGCASNFATGEYHGQAEVTRASAAYANKDYARAAQLLSEPAMKGDRDAQYALGYMYYYGQGVPRDLYRAQSWFETAAKLGHPDAKHALAMLHVYSKLPRSDERPAAVAATPGTSAPNITAAPSNTPVQNAPATPAAAKPVEGTTAAQTGNDAPAKPNDAPPSVRSAEKSNAQAASETVTPKAETPAVAPAKPTEHNTPAQQPLPTSDELPPTTLTFTEQNSASLQTAVAQEEPVAMPSDVVVAAPEQNAVTSVSTDAASAANIVAPTAPSDEKEATSPAVTVFADRVDSAPVVAVLERGTPAEVTLVAGTREPVRMKARLKKVSKPVVVSDESHPRYTLHLLSSRHKEDLIRTVRAHGLEQHAAYYRVKQADGVHYRLIYGGFTSVAEARTAMQSLPKAIYASNPWVNNYPADAPVTRFNGVALQQMAENKRSLR